MKVWQHWSRSARASSLLFGTNVQTDSAIRRRDAQSQSATGRVLEVEHLSKRYDQNVVLRDVTFHVKRGEIFGLLGQNGAGKTTMLETIEGLRSPDAGSIHVFGLPLGRELQRVRAKLGVSLQTPNFWGQIRVREVVDLFRSFYPRPLPLQTLLTMAGLEEVAGSMLKNLSGGQRQRVNICLGLVNDPELILLDEPSVGLDPESRRSLWNVVKNLRYAHKSVLLTTHYLEEAQELCDRVAILHKGVIVRCATPASLIAREQGQALITARLTSSDEEAFRNAIRYVPEAFAIQDGVLKTRSCDVRETVRFMYKWADESGVVLDDLRVGGPSLEDVFLSVVSEHAETELA